VQKIQNYKNYLAALAALIALIVYLPALRNDFVYWDDNLYIFQNTHIQSFDFAFVKWAFLNFSASNWHPLTWMSHALDYAVWGLNPLGHHLTNIILHAVNTFLVVFVIVRLVEVLKERTTETRVSAFLNNRTILIIAGVTGLLFGLHPLHVESVAWVSERKDLLCALFFLLSIMSYAKYARGQESEGGGNARAGLQDAFINKHYFFALGFFILALLSKPMAVTLTVVLLILDWFPLKRIRSFNAFRAVLVEKLPFFALSLISSALTILAQRAGGSLSSIENVPLSIRVLVGAKSLVDYLWKMIVPLNLVPFYPYPKGVSFLSIEYFPAIAIAIGITAACWAMAKTRKVWPAAWGYYVVTLIPVLGIVQVGGQSMADRYTYLPSLGPFLVMGLLIAWVWEKVNTMHQWGLIIKLFCITSALFMVAALSSLTVEQIGRWKNSVELWTYVIDKEPERVPLAYNNLGMFFYKSGQFDMAIENFGKAVAVKSVYIDAYSNLGMAFYRIGQYNEAIENFDKAIALDPEYYKAYNNRALAFGKIGRFDKAIEDYNKTIALKPSSPQVYLNRGNLYFKTGRKEHAIADFQKACDLGDEVGCSVLHQLTQGLNPE
jgi:protein O-mannosyl-transferase